MPFLKEQKNTFIYTDVLLILNIFKADITHTSSK